MRCYFCKEVKGSNFQFSYMSTEEKVLPDACVMRQLTLILWRFLQMFWPEMRRMRGEDSLPRFREESPRKSVPFEMLHLLIV